MLKLTDSRLMPLRCLCTLGGERNLQTEPIEA